MDKARLGSVVVFLVAAGSAMACGSGRGGKDANVATAPATARKVGGVCAAPQAPADPIGKTGSSSTVALAKIGGKRVALVADEDAKAILTIDLDTRAPLAETALDATPGQLYVGKDGRIFVTLRDKNQLMVLGATKANAPLTTLCTATTPSEPIALAATPDDSQVIVATGWGQKLATFDAATLTPKYEAKVPREPRSVVISDDGKTAFVAHAVGSVISAVDLASPKHDARLVSVRGFFPQQTDQIKAHKKHIAILKASNPREGAKVETDFNAQVKRFEDGRATCQGFTLAKSSVAAPGRIFAPAVMVEPGEPQSRPDGYGDVHQPTENPAVAVLDEGTSEPLDSTVMLQTDKFFARLRGNDARDPKPECLLPRASTIDPASKSLLVTCFGIDAVVAYDATAAMPLAAERRRWTVGSGPTGVAVDTEKNRGVVWAQFDRSLATFPIGNIALVDDKTTPLAIEKTMMPALKTKLPAEFALGRILFHAAGDGRISHDGRACASCHPDGRDDAITWATPEGPRRSIMLAGRVTKTAPYAWNGNASSLHNHLGNTFDRLSGKGLRSIELDALVTYISSLPAPTPEALAPAEKAKAERGKQIFASREAGCASCHTGSDYTDNRNHDVGSKDKADRGGAFNTPSLHLVGGTGPYFHDGRYTSLGDLLVQSDGKMGHTKHLTPADLEALETFLKTL
jgi:mono/diheme cytochrome c family protein